MREQFDDPMIGTAGKTLAIVSLTAAALAYSDAAHAFRCKNKIVHDGMHEQQVLSKCGQPASVRHLGYTVRPYYAYSRTQIGGINTSHVLPGYGHFNQQVVITEYVYNFGPRKLMRRLVFEGGVLVTIESIGYGYHSKNKTR